MQASSSENLRTGKNRPQAVHGKGLSCPGGEPGAWGTKRFPCGNSSLTGTGRKRHIMSLLTAKEIMDILPHRYPFLLIDTIEELEPGVRALGRKCVSINEPYFQGHFPGNPVMPGVLILEALAQVGAAAILSQPEWKGGTAYFAGVDKARFRQKVVPGDILSLETTIIKVKGPVGVGRAVATVNGKKAAEAELTFAIG